MEKLPSQQMRKLSELMKSGFQDYAMTHGNRMRIGSVTDSPEKNTALIRTYGTEFVRILDGQTDRQGDLPPLRQDLFHLIENGCPKLDIIQLAFACTRGRSLAASDTLASIGLAGPSFQILAELCELVSQKIAALDVAGGPVDSLSELLPELPDNEDRARFVEQLRVLPQTLSFYGNFLGLYVQKKVVRTKVERIQKDYELILFYNLLGHYGFGFPTLSRLLMAMRWVRFRVSPKARYVRRFSAVRVKGDKRRDPFGVAALQRRLHRFSKEYVDWQLLLHWWVLRYLSDEWSAKRASGETLLDLMSEIGKKRMNAIVPVVAGSDPESRQTYQMIIPLPLP